MYHKSVVLGMDQFISVLNSWWTEQYPSLVTLVTVMHYSNNEQDAALFLTNLLGQ